jgi:hypothetical protein
MAMATSSQPTPNLPPAGRRVLRNAVMELNAWHDIARSVMREATDTFERNELLVFVQRIGDVSMRLERLLDATQPEGEQR